VNDGLLAADQGMVTIVVLLDYSAAFDTVDNAVALDILEKKFGISHLCLEWFCSYLSGRTFILSHSQLADILDCSPRFQPTTRLNAWPPSLFDLRV